MDRSRTHALVLLTGLILMGVCIRDTLQVVDFLAFCGRAQHIWEQWVDPRYPPYYPLTLNAVNGLIGEARISGILISVGCGLWLLHISNHLTTKGALALMCSSPFVIWSGTAGTDLPAAALSVGAILLAKQNSRWAGIVAGIAFGCRYTALAAIPSVLWMSKDKRQTALWIVLVSVPIWLPPLWTGLPAFDMSSNERGPLSVVFGPNLQHGLMVIAKSPFVWLGFMAFAFTPQSKMNRALILAAITHLVGCSLYFTNPRLMLPIFLAIPICMNQIKGNHIYIAALLFGIGAQQFLSPRHISHAPPTTVIDILSDSEDCFVSNTPWAYQRLKDGWYKPGNALQDLGHPLDKTSILDGLKHQECSKLVLDLNYPFPKSMGDSHEAVLSAGHWRIYGL